MPLATVSSPFNYLIHQIQRDLTRGVELCGEVRRNRHVGSQHRQLDELEDALRDGPYFITRECRNITDIEGTDIDGGDGIARSDLTCYVRSVEEINEHLASLAYPKTHHPEHHHDSRHGSHSRLLFFPSSNPVQPHHKDKEDPHFHELRLKWEDVKDGISHTFSQMRYRLEKEAEVNKKKKDGEIEAKSKKKNEDDKCKADMERAEQKANEAQKALQAKLDAKEAECMRRLSLKDNWDIAKLEHIEDIAQQRDREVEKLVKNKLGDDPIDQIDRLAGVIGHIQRVITPRGSYDTAHQAPINLNVSSSRAFADSRNSGGGGCAQQPVIYPPLQQPVLFPPSQAPVFLPSTQQPPIFIYEQPHEYYREVPVHWGGLGYWQGSPRSSFTSHHSPRSHRSESPPHSPARTVINNFLESGYGAADDEMVLMNGDGLDVHEGNRRGRRIIRTVSNPEHRRSLSERRLIDSHGRRVHPDERPHEHHGDGFAWVGRV